MKVMCLGSNCVSLTYPGDMRVPGPVDNWSSNHGLSSAVHLFTDFEDQIKNGFLKIVEKEHLDFKGDSPVKYVYESHTCHHVNMTNPEIVEKVLNRLNDFRSFVSEVKTKKDCFFSYNVSPIDVVKEDGKWVLTEKAKAALKTLGTYFPLNKLILVGTPEIIFINMEAFLDEVPPEVNYVNIYRIVNPGRASVKKNRKDFADYMNKLVGIKPPQTPKSIEATKKPAPKRTEFHEDYWDE